MSVATKKLVYFLLACDRERARRFLLKNPRPLAENKAFPPRFLKKTRKAFTARPRPAEQSPATDPLLSDWRDFCKNSPYEEVLPLILWGILKYPPEKVSYMLKVSPEVLSFRFKSGFLSLTEYLKEESTVEKPAKKKDLSEELSYLGALADQSLPEDLRQISLTPASKLKYVLPALGAVIVFLLAVGVWLFFRSSSEKILYRSFLNDL